MEPFESLSLTEPASTVDRVTEELRRALFEGEVEAGTPLREQAIAGSLGVARSTVREALAALVAEGLATRVPNRGVAVSSPDAAAVRDICAGRFILEGAGVRAWAAATAEARADVHQTLDDYITEVHAGASYRDLNERHLAFHASLVALTGSPRLIQMHEQLVIELKLTLAQVDRIRRNSHEQADSHADLVALLDADDVEGAYAFLDKHLADAADSIIDALAL